MTTNRRTLKGLKTFDVVVERLDSEAEGGGLSQDQVKTDVELLLRKARVPVADSCSSAYLYVNVNATRFPKGGWEFSTSVGLNQSVTLDRDKSISFLAETWHTATLGAASDGLFVSKVREYLGDLVDKFINDYLAESP